MITQNHSLDSICTWLKSWASTNKSPHEVVTDESDATIGACVLAFTQFKTTNEYLDGTMNTLLHGADPPTAFLRLDRSHFVRRILTNKHIGKEGSMKRSLIVGIFGYLIQCTRLKEVEKIINLIFLVIRSPYKHPKVTHAQEMLYNLVKDHKIDEGSDPNISVDEDKQIDVCKENSVDFRSKIDSYKTTLNYRWVTGIIESIDTANSDDDKLYGKNDYYAPKLEKLLIYYFVRIPMWSNVLCSSVNSTNFHPTSSNVESTFKYIKRLLNIKTYRVDVFVEEHIKDIVGAFKIAIAEQQNSIKLSDSELNETSIPNKIATSPQSQNSNISTSNKNLSSSPPENKKRIIFENWRGKVKKEVPIGRSKHSILNSHDLNFTYHGIPSLRNGYATPKVKNTKSIVTFKTCGFDSIFSVYATAYFDNDFIKSEFDIDTSEFSCFIQEIFQKRDHKFDKLHYINRNKLLYNVYSQGLTYQKSIYEDDTLIKINCTTTIAALHSKLTENSNILASIVKTKSCISCNKKTDRFVAAVPLRINGINLVNIQTAIMDSKERSVKCEVCHCKMNKQTKYRNILAFEVAGCQGKKISEIQEYIELSDAVYGLFGVIEHQFDIEHFIAHVKRENGFWQTFDDLNINTKSHAANKAMQTKKISIHMIF